MSIYDIHHQRFKFNCYVIGTTVVPYVTYLPFDKHSSITIIKLARLYYLHNNISNNTIKL